MKARSRLNHVAAGLLGSLVSRKNDVDGYWAPGLLFHDASASPHAMTLDLLTGSSSPESNAGKLMMASYSLFLRAALAKQGFAWNEVTQATITFQFNASVPDPDLASSCSGAPFICSVALATVHGHRSAASAIGRCEPRSRGLFGGALEWRG